MIKKLKDNKGFTLIELLVILTVVAILAAMAIPSFSGYIKRGKAKADIASVQAAKMVARLEYKLDGGFGTRTYYYDGDDVYTKAELGTTKTISGYGQSDVELPDTRYHLPDDDAIGVPLGKYVGVTISRDGTITARWTDGSDMGDYEDDTSSGTTEESTGKNIWWDRVNVYTTWEKMHADGYANLVPGTVFSDGDRLFVACENSNYYSNLSQYNSAEEFMNSQNSLSWNPNLLKIVELKADTQYWEKDEPVSNINILQGTIWKYNGKYYIANNFQGIGSTQFITPLTKGDGENWSQFGWQE